MMRDRLFHAQGEAAVGPRPPVPYNRVNMGATKPSAASPPQPQAQEAPSTVTSITTQVQFSHSKSLNGNILWSLPYKHVEHIC